MKRYRFYLVAIMIGVIFAAYFIWSEQNQANTADIPEVSAAAAVFPLPEHTTYDMEVYLDINDRTLHGVTVIDTVNSTGQILEELWFTAYPNAFAGPNLTPAPEEAYYSGFNEGWLKVDRLTVNGVAAELQEEDISIRALLPSALLPEKGVKIKIEWKAKIPKLAYRYGYKAGIYMLGNFYPTLNVFDDDNWHNSYNSLFGDPFCFQVASYNVTVNLPEVYDMVSTGNITRIQAEDNGRTIYWVQADMVRDFCLLVTYDYEETACNIQGYDIKCYAPSNNNDITNRIVEQSGEILQYYSSLVGSYPYSDFKVAFVPMKGFHGMEYSGLIFLREECLEPAYDEQQRQFLLAHEIAHQWWYGMVGNDQLREPWLDEGLANWMAYKYLEKYQGKTIPAAAVKPPDIKLSKQLAEMRSRRDYYSTAYDGGEAFWFGLEQELGEDTVTKVLRTYLADYKFKIATSQELLAIIKKEARKDMEPYFSQWF